MFNIPFHEQNFCIYTQLGSMKSEEINNCKVITKDSMEIASIILCPEFKRQWKDNILRRKKT